MSERTDANAAIIAEFRARGGMVGGDFTAVPLLLLTTRGAHSGEPRVTPLAYVRDGASYIVAAANGGRSMNPGWLHNLRAAPSAIVEVGADTFAVTARVAEHGERVELYALLAERVPVFATFPQRTSREIPVVILEPSA
jgi:deazaflavin-dependent oxidoreductase (nitroreductase family)